jgi:PKD repeat protein
LAFHSTSTNSLYAAWDFNNDGRTDGVGENIEHTFTEPGTYPVRLTVTGFGGSDSVVQVINILVNPSSIYPILNGFSGVSTDPILGTKVACAGATITLFGEPGMSSYLWSNGATTPNIAFTIDTTVNVFLTVTDNSGRQITNCEPVIINVNPPPTLTIAEGADTIDCQDLMTIRLYPTPYWFPNTNNWYDNGNWLSINQYVLANPGYSPGNHSVWVANQVDPIGCVTNSDTLNFFVNDAPPVFLTQQGNELYLPFRCLYTTWFQDGNPLTINDSVLTITANGCYYANCSSCEYLNSDTICITTVGLMNSLRSDGVSIYPNPFTSETTIAFDQEQIQATITVIDALGKNIRSEQFSGKQFTFRKDDISSGVYFLRIENKLNQILYKKMIVQ